VLFVFAFVFVRTHKVGTPTVVMHLVFIGYTKQSINVTVEQMTLQWALDNGIEAKYQATIV
jgi:hypothetical protein